VKSQTKSPLPLLESGRRTAKVRASGKPPGEGDRPRLRSTILKAAGEVFLEKGFDEFSMRQVAARIGYSATTIYHHFLNKEELLKALLDEAFTEFDGAMGSAMASAMDPHTRMGALGKAYVRFGLAHPIHYQLMYLRRPQWLIDETHASGAAYRLGYRMLLQGVEDGIREGWLPRTEPQRLADWMWATVHGLVMLGLTEFRENPERLEAAMTLFDHPSTPQEPPGGSP